MQQQHESFNDRYPAPNNYGPFGGNNFNQHGISDGYMHNRPPTDFINNQMMVNIAFKLQTVIFSCYTLLFIIIVLISRGGLIR